MLRLCCIMILLSVTSIGAVVAQTIDESIKPIMELFSTIWNSPENMKVYNLGKSILTDIQDDDNTFPGTIVKREYKIDTEQFVINAWDCYTANEDWNNLQVFILRKESASDFKLPMGLFDNLKNAFGEPFKIVDCGFISDASKTNFAVSSMQAEWIKDKRRIWFRTENFLLNGAPIPAYISIQIAGSQVRDDLVDLIFLRMQPRTIIYPVDGTELPFNQQPFIIIIDLNSGRIFDPNWIHKGTIDVTYPSKLIASWGSEDSNSTMTIDRYAGTFEFEMDADAKLSPTGRNKVKGSFEKIEASRAKIF